jgi:hypothetical protein
MTKSNTAEKPFATLESSDVQLLNLARHLGVFSPSRSEIERDFLNELWATDMSPHASSTLLRNLSEIPGLFEIALQPLPGNAEKEAYFPRVSATIIRAGERHDPRKAKFPTYARHRMKGLAKDILKSLHPTESLDDTEDAEQLRDVIPTGDEYYRSYAPGGQKSVIPVPGDDWANDWLVGNGMERRARALAEIAKASGLTPREWRIMQNEKSEAVPWKDLARLLGMTEPAMSMARTRLIKKLQRHVKSGL